MATLPFGETSAIQCNWASTALRPSAGLLAAGLVFPFTSFQGIFLSCFKDRFKSLAVVRCRGEGQFSEDQDVVEPHYPLWVNENSDEGDSTMSAETIPFEIQVECTGRRDRGEKASRSGTEEIRVGVDVEVVMLSQETRK